MTHTSLNILLQSGIDVQVQQALQILEQQKSLPKEIFTEAYMAWQNTQDPNIKKQIKALFKKYASADWQLILHDKYLFATLAKMPRNKSFAKKIEEKIFVFTTIADLNVAQLIAYFFPNFTNVLWQYVNVHYPTQLFDWLKSATIVNLSQMELKELPKGIEDLKNIEALYLQGNKLKTLPSFIGNFQKLKILDISNNQLTALPNEFTQLNQLEMLLLEGNKIKNFPTAICQIPSLKTLQITNNPFTQLPKEIKNLNNLEVFSFPVVENFPVGLSHFPKLQNISELFLTIESLPDDLGNLTQLTEQHINNLLKWDDFNVQYYLDSASKIIFSLLESKKLTLINKVSPDFYKKLQGLNTLDVSHSHVTSLPPNISFLQNLSRLKLNGNDFSKDYEKLQKLNTLKNLEVLGLAGCKISQLPENWNIENLENLDLNWNNFSKNYEELTKLSTLKKLKSLHLESCKISQLPENWNIVNLESLNLHNNDFSKNPEELENLTSLKNLKYLNLNSCKLIKFPMMLADLPNLKRLELSYNDLDTTYNIPALKQLEELFLASYYFTDIFENIEVLENLKILELGYVNLIQNHQSLSKLSTLKKLKKLVLRYCRISQFPKDWHLESLEELTMFLDVRDYPLKNVEVLLNLEKLKILQINDEEAYPKEILTALIAKGVQIIESPYYR